MIENKLKITFINPPHADWSLANNTAYFQFQSHYNRSGNYPDNVEWLEPPIQWNSYTDYYQVYDEICSADIVLYSCYAWNYTICDGVAKLFKEKNPNIINVLGGPHIGTNEPEFLATRTMYDYICKPTKPGEVFMEDMINMWFENGIVAEDISWELRSNKQTVFNIAKQDYSIYEDHIDLLTKAHTYAIDNKLEPLLTLETTRGCPYQCVFCEWGGGIGGKVYKKNLDIVKRDIDAIKKIGHRDVYLTDANFGMFHDRDLEFFKYAWDKKLYVSEVSTVKFKDLKRRKRLVDSWFDIIGIGDSETNISVVPTISIQSVSEEAMKIANRVDLSRIDKIAMSEHIRYKCQMQGYPSPAMELILGMPGSTLEDFYTEFKLIWNFRSWTTSDLEHWSMFRHDYMFLPDSKLNSQEYKDKYNIKTVEVFSDIVDEDGLDNRNSLYKDKKTYFKTIRSCYSFTTEDLYEMWFMNQAGVWFLKNIYSNIENIIEADKFAKICYDVVKTLDGFDKIMEHIKDLLDPNTPPKSVKKIDDKFRQVAIEEFLNKYKIFIKSLVLSQVLEISSQMNKPSKIYLDNSRIMPVLTSDIKAIML